jgi:hypothetical protein
MERSQLQGVLVGLRTAVDEEQTVVLITTYLAQAVGQLLLELVHHGVAVEPQLGHLSADGFHIMRMRMTDADDGMSAIEVKIFCALFVPYAATLATHDIDGEKGIDVEESH